MKHRNLFLMMLAALCVLPLSMSAKKGMGWLHLGQGDSDTYYDEKGKTVRVSYGSKSYEAYPVIGNAGAYYVPNEKNTGTKREDLKILYLQNVTLSKNIRCTKSTTNLIIVVSGKNTLTFNNGSVIKLEKGNVVIAGNDPAKDYLTLNTKDSYHGAFAPGSITIENVSLTINCANKAAALSAESSSSNLAIRNSNVKSNGTMYSKGKIITTNCGFAEDEGSRLIFKDNYMFWKDRNVKYSPNIKNSGVYWTIDTSKSPSPVQSASQLVLPGGFDLFGLQRFTPSATTNDGAKLSIAASDATIKELATGGGIFWNVSTGVLTFKDVSVQTTKSQILHYWDNAKSLKVQIVGNVTLKGKDWAFYCKNGAKELDIVGVNGGKIQFNGEGAKVDGGLLKVEAGIETNNASYVFMGNNNSKLSLNTYKANKPIDLNASITPIKGFAQVDMVGRFNAANATNGVLYDTKNKQFVYRPTTAGKPQPLKKLSFAAGNSANSTLLTESNKIMIDGVAHVKFQENTGAGTVVFPGKTVTLPFTLLGKKDWATKNVWKTMQVNGRENMCVELDIPSSMLTSGKVYWVISNTSVVLDEGAQINTGNKSFVADGCNYIKVNQASSNKACSINSGSATALVSPANSGLIIESTNSQQLSITTSSASCISSNGDLQLERVSLNLRQTVANASAIKVKGNVKTSFTTITITQGGSSSVTAGIECTATGKTCELKSCTLNANTRASSVKGFDRVTGYLPTLYQGKDFYYDKTNKRFMMGQKQVNTLQTKGSGGGCLNMDTNSKTEKRGNLNVWPLSDAKAMPAIAQ